MDALDRRAVDRALIEAQQRHPIQQCHDCERASRVQMHSVITDDGTGRIYCDGCYRERAARGLEFDPRSRSQIAQELGSRVA